MLSLKDSLVSGWPEEALNHRVLLALCHVVVEGNANRALVKVLGYRKTVWNESEFPIIGLPRYGDVMNVYADPVRSKFFEQVAARQRTAAFGKTNHIKVPRRKIVVRIKQRSHEIAVGKKLVIPFCQFRSVGNKAAEPANLR